MKNNSLKPIKINTNFGTFTVNALILIKDCISPLQMHLLYFKNDFLEKFIVGLP